MATLEWIRDNYDSNKNGYIEESEMRVAEAGWTNGTISGLDFTSVFDAYKDHTLLPTYGGITVMDYTEISINMPIGATLNIDEVEVI